ncbi:acetyl-CoA carboxylase carboxyltransferase subunit alpha/beta [Actinokineospora sp. NBRC 105648]|uniref:acetyl-CoA carboxylase carboxyltransferase subunit alpha/beta n=1 Tax=Actinokineospora sp. NBRC 105648 TaxID=3032206 RepID=UPI00255417FE|nr:acetyl-CoA carboxylase carboxyltransferase subunit alpha/beta [Actinokineospora sp. NBRC 105648]
MCPSCGHHAALDPRARIATLLDRGSFAPVAFGDGLLDPLGFVDRVPYPERLAAARERTGEQEAVVVGTGRIGGVATALAVLDFRFLGGSLGVGVGERLTGLLEHALVERLPLVLVTASGGARMQEGVLSLMQMAKVSQAMAAMRAAGLGTVSVITDPTYGGVAASFATQSDVLLAEPGARLGFAGPRVIRQTIGATLPPGLQTAEYLHATGMLDQVVPRSRLRDVLAELLDLVAVDRRVTAPARPPRVLADRPVRADTPRDGWSTVRIARDRDRPTAREYLARMCESFVELHGDRVGGDSATVVGGLARLGGRSVVVVGTQKGHTSAELTATSFGMAGPDGYRKALRLFALAERLGLPVVTLVDTPGAHPGPVAERGGQALVIAESILALTTLRVPVVAAVVGEGGSGGALALAVADQVLMSEHAVYSVISPEGCAAILWGPGQAEQAANALRLTAPDLVALGVVDRVVPEPDGGTQADHAEAAALLAAALERALSGLAELPRAELVARRRDRLRRLGAAPGAVERTETVGVAS